MLTDSHAHLDSSALRPDLDAVLSRAAAAGISRIIAIGCDLVSSRACLQLAEQHPAIEATVGVHPTYVTEVTDPDWLDQLRALAAHPRCVGIGETGMDFYHPPPDGWSESTYHDRQAAFFEAQLALAAEARLNVVVHQRDRSGLACWDAIRARVIPWHGKLRCVFHCWLHPWETAAPMIAAGHLISFGGVVTYPKAPDAAAAATAAPDGSFMLETDCPYLPPVPHRGKRNEPAFLNLTASHIASLRGSSLEALAASTSATATAFFRRPPSS
jgi:TatD DNase family protein